MNGLLKKRWLSALLMGLVFVVFFGLILFVRSPDGFRGLTSTELAIGAPLLAGLVLGVVSWALMTGPIEEEPESLGEQEACRSCGGTVMSEWRLCPHCGAILSDPFRRDAASA
ncbi:MAG TPA: hypothetical protein VFG89_01350 [Coriobacteriia bacterium]|nr:hypothetical protein [Coriobacteriia bacterium]